MVLLKYSFFKEDAEDDPEQNKKLLFSYHFFSIPLVFICLIYWLVNVDQLNPPTPSIHVADRREAMSPVLRNFCLDTRNPVTVLKGLCKALKLDLSLFTTRMLIDQNPEHSVEIRHQRQQKSDDNLDEEGTHILICTSLF